MASWQEQRAPIRPFSPQCTTAYGTEWHGFRCILVEPSNRPTVQSSNRGMCEPSSTLKLTRPLHRRGWGWVHCHKNQFRAPAGDLLFINWPPELHPNQIVCSWGYFRVVPAEINGCGQGVKFCSFINPPLNPLRREGTLSRRLRVSMEAVGLNS
jgi:hypothetical protein